jgi:hypothetical protein
MMEIVARIPMTTMTMRSSTIVKAGALREYDALHPLISFGRLYSDCNPSTVVLGVEGRRTEEMRGCRERGVLA